MSGGKVKAEGCSSNFTSSLVDSVCERRCTREREGWTRTKIGEWGGLLPPSSRVVHLSTRSLLKFGSPQGRVPYTGQTCPKNVNNPPEIIVTTETL